MSDDSLSSISSSPTHSDISVEDIPNPIIFKPINESTKYIDGNIIHLSKFIVSRADDPRLDDFCRIFGSAIGKAKSNYSLLLATALKNVDKLGESSPLFDIILRGICQHDPKSNEIETLLSIRLVGKIFEILLISHQKSMAELSDKELYTIVGALNWLIWSTQHQSIEIKLESATSLTKFVELSRQTGLCNEIIRQFCNAGLIKRVYPVKEPVGHGVYDFWTHLCNSPFIQSWILSLIDECNSNLHSKIFKFLSLVINYLNENDKKLVIEASIECFHADPDASHIVEILTESLSLGEIPRHYIKKLLKARTPNQQSAQYFKQCEYIIRLLSAIKPTGTTYNYISELLKESIKNTADLLLYKYCLSVHRPMDKVVITEEKDIPLYSISKDILGLNDYFQLLIAAYHQNLDSHPNRDNLMYNYFYRIGVEFGYSAHRAIDHKVAARYEALMDLDEILSPSFVTNSDFVDESEEPVTNYKPVTIDIKSVHIPRRRIIIGKCNGMILPGDIYAGHRMNRYYNAVTFKRNKPRYYLSDYPKWNVIEFNYLLGFETTVTVTGVSEGEWKRSTLILKYPAVHKLPKNKANLYRRILTHKPLEYKESQVIYKVKFEYPLPTSKPVPGKLI